MIECSSLSKAYPNQLVIDDFSYKFQDTGLYLLIGESGSGKTTLLNILAGLIPFERGTVTWNGQAYWEKVDNSNIQESLAYITQDAYFVDFLSVADNLRLIEKDDSRIQSILSRFGLADKINHHPITLSGGEKQRLAIIRALLGNKKVLLLDEPTAALDDLNKQIVFELLANLKNEVLIICSTHDEQACNYTDRIIRFQKPVKQIDNSIQLQQDNAMTAFRSRGGRTEGIRPYLKKWFVSVRKPKAMRLYFAFLTLSFCLFLFADFPGNKVEASIENLYKINMLTVITYDSTCWEDIMPSDEGICEVVLDYSGSCPDGNEDLSPEVIFRPLPNYEITMNVLPQNRDAFMLSDKVKFGSYFTGSDQIILSWEMANALAPGNEESLLGVHISKNLYGLGDVNFEVVGIFDVFNDFEKTYLQAIDIHIATGAAYSAKDYAELCFISSELTNTYSNDQSFYFGNSARRGYRIYFNSYSEMREYYDQYHSVLEANGNVSVSYDSVNIGLFGILEVVFYFALPLSIFVAVFSTLFYVALIKTEYVHNNRFVAVFELSGYSKGAVIQEFVILNIFELIKMLMASVLFAVLLTGGINVLNYQLVFSNFQLFTINPLMLVLFIIAMVCMSSMFVSLMFNKVRVASWYESLIASRDLL